MGRMKRWLVGLSFIALGCGTGQQETASDADVPDTVGLDVFLRPIISRVPWRVRASMCPAATMG
jgi:hypothetical protein